MHQTLLPFPQKDEQGGDPGLGELAAHLLTHGSLAALGMLSPACPCSEQKVGERMDVSGL